ncbi:MAG: DUF2339 domain-containing protein [Rhodothermales bacterium]|nr:DUF2339 domain-containing protein [Rhodothermales bacterium]
MSSNQDPSYDKRLEQLERTVAHLEYTISRLQERLTSSNAPVPPRRPAHHEGSDPRPGTSRLLADVKPAPASETPVPAERPGRVRPMYALNADRWMNRVGLAFVLFGIVFGIKYFLDQAWFTPLLRVLSGLSAGALLTLAGFHWHRKRTRLAQVLLCAGVAMLYLTAFAAYQLYFIVPYPVAYFGMFAVSVGAFLLSIKRDDPVVSILAVFGGLVTPFIMHSQGDNLFGIISYTSLILTGAAVIYWFTGWRSLLFLSAIGGWIVIILCYLNVGLYFESVAADRWLLLFGVLLGWVLFWAMPVVRGILRARYPERYAAPPPVRAVGYFFNHPALPLSVATPLLTFVFSMLIWDLSDNLWGWIALEAAAIYGFLYLYIRGRDLNHLAQMQGFAASVLLVMGLFLLFKEYALLVALASAAAVMRHVARLMKDRIMSFNSHALFLVVISWLTMRLLNVDVAGTPVMNLPALCELAVIVLCASMAPILRRSWMYLIYLFCAHFLFLGWVYREVGSMYGGEALVTAIWTGYGIILFAFSYWNSALLLRRVGIGTLGLTLSKFFLFDLDTVDPLVRVILFLGFGISFLGLSSLLPRLIARNVRISQAPAADATETEGKR